jgi:hypothetical protein
MKAGNRMILGAARILRAFLGGVVLAFALSVGSGQAGASSGLDGKLIVGYQGWFGCPKDFEDNNAWQHWFVKDVRPEYLTVDLLPSVREIKPEDLCDTGLARSDGQGTIKLFSSQNPNVVGTHFRWMRDYGIAGAAAQRFISEMSRPEKKRRSDHVLKNIRAAAEANDRVFFVTYDVSGANPGTVTDDIRRDWRHLTSELKLVESKAYLRDRGKPVLELWGFGVGDRPGAPAQVLALIEDLKNGRDGLAAVTVIGGVPSRWRTLTADSKTDPLWAKVYRAYDVISPWTVGRFADEAGADAWLRDMVMPDLEETRKLGIGYMPVVFPGFSWYNLMTNRNKPDQAVLNRIPRRCGKFLWRQVSNLLDAHVTMLYAAMFDEVDEGTALFPAETRKDRLPAGASMVFLNQDGCALPDDWYLRVTAEAARMLESHALPPGKLEDAIRP